MYLTLHDTERLDLAPCHSEPLAGEAESVSRNLLFLSYTTGVWERAPSPANLSS
jgi:hypothetical protein